MPSNKYVDGQGDEFISHVQRLRHRRRGINLLRVTWGKVWGVIKGVPD